ncbi:probable metabolite transport protein CsbC [Lutzomyia longipalpis]|uniref:probable metabolite transport protein CsbC n=1 Tax=Lutzomyia longipalpis TaxID=7200 RepID=UPI0024838CF0|nr:probable metabolite transport protein CsbC [Lutzomyia longipalpis]
MDIPNDYTLLLECYQIEKWPNVHGGHLFDVFNFLHWSHVGSSSWWFSEAEKSLKFYRGLRSDQPLPESNALEFEEMKKHVSLRSEKTSISLKDFSEPTTILAIIISFVFSGTLNFAGVRITTSFTETLIEDSGIPMNLSLVDTSISSLQIVGCLTSIYIAQRMKFRASLIACYCLSFLGLFGTGLHYFFHRAGYDLSSSTWSFIIFLAISVVLPSTGINNITQSASAMILPLKIRGSVLGTLNVLQLVLATILMQYYLYLSETIGNSVIFTVFSIWCLFGAIFTFFFIPEVNNLAYAEIVVALNEKLSQRFKSLS